MTRCTVVNGKLFTDIVFNTSAPPEYLCYKKDHFNETVNAFPVNFTFKILMFFFIFKQSLSICKSANRFLYDLKNHAQSFRTSHVMVPIGTEFRLLEEFTCFGPADKLIEYITIIFRYFKRIFINNL